MAAHYTYRPSTLPPSGGDEHIFDPDPQRRRMVCVNCGKSRRPTIEERREMWHCFS